MPHGILSGSFCTSVGLLPKPKLFAHLSLLHLLQTFPLPTLPLLMTVLQLLFWPYYIEFLIIKQSHTCSGSFCMFSHVFVYFPPTIYLQGKMIPCTFSRDCDCDPKYMEMQRNRKKQENKNRVAERLYDF